MAGELCAITSVIALHPESDLEKPESATPMNTAMA